MKAPSQIFDNNTKLKETEFTNNNSSNNVEEKVAHQKKKKDEGSLDATPSTKSQLI